MRCIVRPKNQDVIIACEAFNNQTVFNLPVKSKKIKRKNRFFNFYLSIKKNKILLEKRDESGIWANMYQLPLEETKSAKQEYGIIYETKHVLTHQDLFCTFFKDDNPDETNREWVKLSELHSYALPVVIDKFLKQYFK